LWLSQLPCDGKQWENRGIVLAAEQDQPMNTTFAEGSLQLGKLGNCI